MKFEQWLKKQKKRNDPIGDLAMDYISDGGRRKLSLKYLRSKNACYGALVSYIKAKLEFRKLNRISMLDE